MHAMNSAYDTDTGPKRIQDDMLYIYWWTTIQTRSWPSFRNATSQNVNVIGTITSHVRIDDSRGRLILGIVHKPVEPILLEASFTYKLVKGIFPPEQKIVTYNSKLVPILTINVSPEELKDKDDRAQNEMKKKEEHVPCLVRVVKRPKILPRSEKLVSYSTGIDWLVQIESLLSWNSTKAWTTAIATIDTSSSRPFNMIVCY